jgi:hypothetical protein
MVPIFRSTQTFIASGYFPYERWSRFYEEETMGRG